MQAPFVALGALAFASSLLAQTNPFIVFPQDPERQAITAASYVRRPEWNATGEGFQQVTQDLFRGVGDTGGGVALARGFYHWAGDLNGSTPETYGIVLRNATPTGQPDTTPAGVIVQVNNLTTPVTSPVSVGWIMTDVFATPAALPTTASWFQGLYLPANPLWPTGSGTSGPDGHSIWAADTLAAGTPAIVGENGRFTAPPVTWRVNASGGAATTQWTYIMGTLVDSPMLHVGGIDPLSSRTGTLGAPSYGMNGLFPDVSGAPRSDGINVRMHDNVLPAGIAVYAAAFGWWPGGGIPIGFGGDLYLDITGLVLLGAVIPTGGAAVLPIATPGSISPAMIGQQLMWQGMWFDPVVGGGRMTNAQVTIF